MSLGPAGGSLNPEQADNFEDVRSHLFKTLKSCRNDNFIDGEAICRQRSAIESALAPILPSPTTHDSWTNEEIIQRCNT